MKSRLFVFIPLLAAALASAEPRPGRVEISSSPEKAAVIIDGVDRGLTPLMLFDLKPGRHHLKVRLAGYVERDRYFDYSEGEIVQKSVNLEPEKALLLLTSEPSGADVTVDGVASGRTPRLFTELNVKDPYRVILRKPGYRVQTLDLRFPEGRKPRVLHEMLVLDSGTVKVTSEPAGAAVTVNGVDRGVTPVTVTGIPKGRATVKLVKAGFQEEVREISMNAGEEQQLALALKGLPGTLSLSSVPAGARFYLDGEYRGKGEIVLSGLAPREYTVRAELEGYGSLERKIEIGVGATPHEEFRLSNVKGRFEFRTSPAGVQVVLDGRPVGVTREGDAASEFSAILPVENVLEGEHTVVFRKEGYVDRTIHPVIAPMKTQQSTVRMKRAFKPDVEIEIDSGVHRGVLISSNSETVTVEITPGIQRTFPRVDVKRITFLDGRK